MSDAQTKPNWLERHPKKVLGLVVLVVLAIMALATEKLLALRTHHIRNLAGIKRYIKLREFNPLYADILVPNDDALRTSDSLVQKEYVLRIDRDGFIMPSKVHQDPDLVIAFLGGSTTECTYVDEENRFPYLAGRLMEKNYNLKVNSYNAGRSGNNSLHSINVLVNKVLPLKPDVVVMMHNINDLAILLYEKTYWNKHPSRSPIIEKPPTFKTVGKDLEEMGRLIRDLTFPNLSAELHKIFHLGLKSQADEFQGVRGQKIIVDREFLVQEFSRNLQTFINICRAREITPVLMTQPSRLKAEPDPFIAKLMQGMELQQGIGYQEFKGALDLFNQTIREVGAKNQVLVIDLAEAIPQEKEYMCDVAHFNENGSRLVAQRVAEDLQPAIAALKKSRPNLPNRTNLN